MPEPVPVEIPNRALFKAAEVCDIVEGAALRAALVGNGVSRARRRENGGRAARVPARDVEQVLRIKHLLLVEGLTLAGARRKLEEEAAPVAADAPAIDELIGQNARERLTAVKRGLQSILELLAARGSGIRRSRATASSGCRRSRRAAGAAARRVAGPREGGAAAKGRTSRGGATVSWVRRSESRSRF